MEKFPTISKVFLTLLIQTSVRVSQHRIRIAIPYHATRFPEPQFVRFMNAPLNTAVAQTLISTAVENSNSSRNSKIERIWISLHFGLLILSSLIAWHSASTPSRNPTRPVYQTTKKPFRYISTPSIASVSDHEVQEEPNAIADDCQCSRPATNATNSNLQFDPQMSDVWELSSRHLPEKFNCIHPIDPGLRAQRHTQLGWQSEDLQNALIDDGKLVILYVHGNFMERNNALDRVLILNNYLRERSSKPYRLIMLSWPSTREPHPLRDVYENAESAESQALLVAWLLERFSSHADVSLLGFSFGSRAVTGGLHLAAGGTIPGFRYQSGLPTETLQNRYRVALVAPALDRDWLATQGRHSRSLETVSGLVNLYNSKDPILRRFRFIDRLSRPVAAGFAGFIGLPGLESASNPRATMPLVNSNKIRQFDCGSAVGTTHSEKSYYGQCPYFGLVLDHLLGQEANAQPIE